MESRESWLSVNILTTGPNYLTITMLGGWFPRKNSRRHNSFYNIYWFLTQFKFVQLLTQLLPSNLELHFTSTLS